MVLLFRFDAVHIVPGSENGTFFARALNIGEAIFKVRICFASCCSVILLYIQQNTIYFKKLTARTCQAMQCHAVIMMTWCPSNLIGGARMSHDCVLGSMDIVLSVLWLCHAVFHPYRIYFILLGFKYLIRVLKSYYLLQIMAKHW